MGYSEAAGTEWMMTLALVGVGVTPKAGSTVTVTVQVPGVADTSTRPSALTVNPSAGDQS